MREPGAQSPSNKVQRLPEFIISLGYYSTATAAAIDSRILRRLKQPPIRLDHHFGRGVGGRHKHNRDTVVPQSSVSSHVLLERQLREQFSPACSKKKKAVC